MNKHYSTTQTRSTNRPTLHVWTARPPFLRPPTRALWWALSLLVMVAACDSTSDPIERDLSAIQQRDTLVALLTYNSTGYFVYRGQPMGYEYELLRTLAESQDVALQTHLVRDRAELLELLNSGVGDIVAARLLENEIDTTAALHTRALYSTRPMLVQRTGDDPSLPAPVDALLTSDSGLTVGARIIRDRSQLGDREVHVGRGSPFIDRLVELSDSITGDISIVELDSATEESLVRGVATGEYELSVAPENIAQLRAEYYANVAVVPALGEEIPIVWAVRRNAPGLRDALNAWLDQQEEQGVLESLYQKYFVDRLGYRERVESEYLTSETGRLSEYDDILKRHAATIGWDWRLLASQTYQESKFDSNARSWAGAMGLLQLMPGTAREVDVAQPFDPEQNVAGAVRYLQMLTEQWQDEIPDEGERLRFVLASYNTGRGHVLDAQRLAEKNGDDPLRWADVAFWLLRKSEREVYTDPVVRHGFSRGLEPVTYVSLILDRYDHYEEFVLDGRGVAAR